MKMKGIDEAVLIDLGIPLDKMTEETYPEYVKVLRDEPFRKKVNGGEVNVEEIAFEWSNFSFPNTRLWLGVIVWLYPETTQFSGDEEQTKQARRRGSIKRTCQRLL